MSIFKQAILKDYFLQYFSNGHKIRARYILQGYVSQLRLYWQLTLRGVDVRCLVINSTPGVYLLAHLQVRIIALIVWREKHPFSYMLWYVKIHQSHLSYFKYSLSKNI